MNMNYNDMTNEKNKKLTDDDLEFIGYFLNKLETYIGKKPVDRIALIEAIALMAKTVFCEETPYDIKGQCNEIYIFCNHLKKYALRNAVRS